MGSVATGATVRDIASLGIVGAGGAGFPLARKLAAQAEIQQAGLGPPIYLVNAAECEPLLHKDKEVARAFADQMFAGLRVAMQAVGAREGIVGVKAKYEDVIEILRAKAPANVRLHLMGNYYPAGDEFILVYDATRRVIPPGGLPLHVGCVVSNVETLVNLGRGRPVTRKYLTVAGAVANPVTIETPIGATLGEAVAAAGGATADRWAIRATCWAIRSSRTWRCAPKDSPASNCAWFWGPPSVASAICAR
ncbi:MAG: SLBB domain-containing protein [Candidatus Sumerlaeota bacterium]|nr:SLBB domain-containing protein [Candidatus Sumerlaeota bacterium]